MKIYKVKHYNDEEGSQGFEWFSNKAIAIKAQKDWNFLNMGNREIDEHEIKLNKTDILDFLNAHCSYPDNG